MDPWQTFFLGIVQGLGEFLPISSSAHLILLPWFFQWENFGLEYDVALHVGTLAAVLTYYHKLWLRILCAFLRPQGEAAAQDRRLFYYVCAATVPGVIAGVLLKSFAETVFRNPLLIASTLSTMGILLWLADEKVKDKTQTLSGVTLRQALLIGIAQCFALVPGFSRSGTTITAALLLRFQRADAAHFSFLLSVPITAGAIVFEAPAIFRNQLYLEPGFWLGIATAAIVGFSAIAILVRYVSKHSFLPFTVYRVMLALLVAGVYFFRS